MSTYNPGVVVQREFVDGFAQIRVEDSDAMELFIQAIVQLKIISLKLDCLQPDGDVIDDNELDTLESE